MTEYKFTVPNGTYDVRLRFAEFSSSAIGARAMAITFENVPYTVDIAASAPGMNVAYDRVFTGVSVTDGLLNIGFARAAGASADPVVSGIEVKN